MSTKTRSIYQRLNVPEVGWRYTKIKTGRGVKTGELVPPFFIRIATGTKLDKHGVPQSVQKWHKLTANSFQDAATEAETPIVLAPVGDVAGDGGARTAASDAIDVFLAETEKKRSAATVMAYRVILAGFLKFLRDARIAHLEQVNRAVLRDFRDSLVAEGYAVPTLHTRLISVLTLLKANGVKTEFAISRDLPKIDQKPAVAYSTDEIQKLLAAATPDERIRFKFFLGSGARDREVQFATWADIDFHKNLFHIRPKPDAGFFIKNHETRTVRLPQDLIDDLKKYKQTAPHARWLFVSREGKPDERMLDKLKRVAHRAGLSCGHCKTFHSLGRFKKKTLRELSCANSPVCQKFYLHRFRKTAATRWSDAGIPIRMIQDLLGHADLNTTQIYLGSGELADHAKKFDTAFAGAV